MTTKLILCGLGVLLTGGSAVVGRKLFPEKEKTKVQSSSGTGESKDAADNCTKPEKKAEDCPAQESSGTENECAPSTEAQKECPKKPEVQSQGR